MSEWVKQPRGNYTRDLAEDHRTWVSVLTRETGFTFAPVDTETAFCRVNDAGERETIIATSYDVRDHDSPDWTADDYERAVREAGNWWQGSRALPGGAA